jgi:sporulation and cell division protein SsgA
VTCHLDVQLVVPGESTVPLGVVLRYSAGDPYAVNAEFRTGAEESVDWVFARDLLSTGVHRATGEGDVRVWPSPSATGREVFIALTSPDGQALLKAPAAELMSFLARTYALVPAGSERVDIDATLEALLNH